MRRECYWMISKYVKEQKRYTQDELRKIFECTADETVQIIRKLKEYGIVKNVKKSDMQSMLSDLVEEGYQSNRYRKRRAGIILCVFICWSNCCIWTGIKVLS